MEWLRFTDLERDYGAKRVFAGLSGVLRDDAKVGLVGPNGAGKSSLVRILAGVETPDHGETVRARDARAGYLGQGASERQDATLREILAGAFERIHADETRVRALEQELADAAASHDADRQERALRAYGEARDAYDRHGGADLERRMRSMLAALGFEEADLDRKAGAFSGGQRTRVALARMFLEEPDYLILDEPTNHLDIETVRWLEEFLIADPRAMLVVSHDRYFLDRVVNEIWELDGGALARYEVQRGAGYSEYLVQKAERAELAQRDYEKFLAEQDRRKAVVAELRTHGSHNYSHVRSREKQLAKLDVVEAPRTSQQKISVRLDAARRATGGPAISARKLAKAYEKPLFTDLSFELARGERLAIVGPNGAGKTSLLRILNGTGAPDRGVVKVMDGVSTASFAQDAADELPPAVSAVDAVLDGATVLPEEARALLGRLGLGGDAGDKPVEAFSGGERRRIMLARLMARSADLLFLDEPTNDLDIPSREALEEVLAGYGGAIVVISHDRYLLRRLAQKVLWLRDGTATFLDGGYDAFESMQRPGARIERERRAKEQPKAASSAKVEREERLSKERASRELAACEREVARLDAERGRLQLEFADPVIYDNPERVALLQAELRATEARLDEAYARWESLVGEPATAG